MPNDIKHMNYFRNDLGRMSTNIWIVISDLSFIQQNILISSIQNDFYAHRTDSKSCT